jgi:hemerythrin-like domain-containing protein
VCSYCGCQAIEVVGRLTEEHEAIVNALGELRRAVAGSRHEDVRGSADRLGALLAPHTQAEEVGLFGVLRRDPAFADHVDRLCAEHAALDTMLAAVVAGDHSVVEAFAHALRRHIDREENGIFPAAAIGLDGPEWEEVHALTPSPPGGLSRPRRSPAVRSSPQTAHRRGR